MADPLRNRPPRRGPAGRTICYCAGLERAGAAFSKVSRSGCPRGAGFVFLMSLLQNPLKTRIFA